MHFVYYFKVSFRVKEVVTKKLYYSFGGFSEITKNEPYGTLLQASTDYGEIPSEDYRNVHTDILPGY